MHPEHRRLLEDLRGAARPPDPGFDAGGYLGSGHPFLNVSVPDRRAIAKAWLREHKSASASELRAVADSLFGGDSHEEKTLAALLIAASRPLREASGAADVDRWLGVLVGWAEVDTLCQNVFEPAQMLAHWGAWRGLVRALAADANINKRRAALVLLTGPVRRSPDPRLSALAFETIERLKGERPILITKAVSWLLRSLIGHHREALAAYLDAQGPTLPAIAVRETRTKLLTGVKTP